MKGSSANETTSSPVEANPMKKVIPKRTKLRDFEGCSSLKEYELLEKIGEGTFGEVHKARHKKTKDTVALKRILMHNEKDGFPITALREIKILKMLSHPNVIRLSDMTIERGDKAKKKRGSIFMVTPYMDHDLCGLLDNKSVEFSVPQIKCYMKQLLQGTQYLHDKRILHRDVKAANLLISNQGILQIADFGLARMYHEEPPPGSNEPGREYTNMVVTRWYRPPELLLGERRYSTAIDIWGVGCILAEMYKSKPILQGASDIDQLDRIFQLCGTPTESTMPGWTLLPGCDGIKSFKNYPRQLEKQYEKHGKDMADLLGLLLRLNPERRLTASQALEHAYFQNEPVAARPEDLPQYTASHEFDRRKNETGRSDARPPRAPDAAGAMLNGNQNSQAMAPRDNSFYTTTSSTEKRQPSAAREPAYDVRPPAHQRDTRDRSRHRYDEPRSGDWSRRDDRYRDSYRARDRSHGRERERDRSLDRHGSTERRGVSSYARSTQSPPSQRRNRSPDRYAPDPREGRSAGRASYADDRYWRTTDRTDREREAMRRDDPRSRPRSRSRSQDRDHRRR